MKLYREKQEEQAIVEKILWSLTSEFDHIMVAIEETHDLSLMFIDELSGTLQAHEQRMNEKKAKKQIEQALQAQAFIKGGQNGDASKKIG